MSEFYQLFSHGASSIGVVVGGLPGFPPVGTLANEPVGFFLCVGCMTDDVDCAVAREHGRPGSGIGVFAMADFLNNGPGFTAVQGASDNPNTGLAPGNLTGADHDYQVVAAHRRGHRRAL